MSFVFDVGDENPNSYPSRLRESLFLVQLRGTAASETGDTNCGAHGWNDAAKDAAVAEIVGVP